MQRMICALLLSFVAMLVVSPRVIPVLHRLKFGQTIYDLGPKSHKSKQGTPTMGGIMMAGVTFVTSLVLHPKGWYGVEDFMLALLAVSMLSMLIGFGDDFIKVAKKRSLGLTPWQKIAGQVVVAVGFTLWCYFHPQIGSRIFVPFLNVEWDLGIWYIPLMSLTVIFMVNSANLQDGLDGLLSSVASIGSAAWGVMALFFLSAVSGLNNAELNNNYYAVAIFAMGVMGSCLGFLRINHYPARIFMGDTGSMFIGGATVGMAMVLRQPLMLLLIAFTMVGSSLSVMMQVTYFKLTHGKRIFKMSPIHHHFELCGYSETQIVSMYAVVTGILSFIAVLSMNGLRLY